MQTYLSELKELNEKWGVDSKTNKNYTLTRSIILFVKKYEERKQVIKDFVKQTKIYY